MDADLVFEGGGVIGIGLVGAYSALCDAGYTFHRVAGSSAGAIVGALIAVGMEPNERVTVIRTVEYGRFKHEGFIDHTSGAWARGSRSCSRRGSTRAVTCASGWTGSSRHSASPRSETSGSTIRTRSARRRKRMGSS